MTAQEQVPVEPVREPVHVSSALDDLFAGWGK